MHTGNALVERTGPAPGALLLLAGAVQAMLVCACGTPSPGPHVDQEGAAHLPPLTVPASRFMSPEARAKFIEHFAHPAAPAAAAPSGPPDFAAMRADDERRNAPFVARAQVLYPVNIEERVIGGVRTQVITPRAGVAPENREDVTAVYCELLKDHRPANIGIYGCSAGGILAAEAVAWF